MGAEEFSIAEFQKLNEYASSSDESEEAESHFQEPPEEQSPESDFPEEDSSDEEVEVDMNNLSALVTKSEKKVKPKAVKDIDSLFSTTKLKHKEENELNKVKELKKEQIVRHFARFEEKKQEKQVKEVTFKEWHVPLMEVPTREHEPKAKRKKRD